MDGWTGSVQAAEAVDNGADPATVRGTPEYDAKRAADLKLWEDAKAAVASWTEYERKLRAHIAATYYVEPRAGVNNQELPDGRTLKYTRKVTYKLDADNDKIESTMDAIENCGNVGKVLVNRLIKTTYDLSSSEYKKLDVTNPSEKAIKDLIDGILTTKDGSPTLELRDAKVEE